MAIPELRKRCYDASTYYFTLNFINERTGVGYTPTSLTYYVVDADRTILTSATVNPTSSEYILKIPNQYNECSDRINNQREPRFVLLVIEYGSNFYTKQYQYYIDCIVAVDSYGG